MPQQQSGKNAEQSHEERLKALRERLYSRGRELPPEERHELHTEQKRDVARAWPARTVPPRPVQAPTPAPQPVTPTVEPESIFAMPHSKKRTYRTVLIALGVTFFVGALGLSAALLFFGANTISGDNITVGVSGPFAVGGGEELPLQIAIANQNSVAIDSATLIIEYPPGTQAADGSELFRERKQLNRIGSGEVLNIPLRVLVFGEENEEKTVTASVEYRVQGSNATFFKEAEPFKFKISSSPVVISVEAVKQLASGQEVALDLTISSNAPTPLSDILIKAEYPYGFDFTESTPSPISGRDTWRINELLPEKQTSIRVRGVLTGEQGDTRVFRFSVGVANERDQYGLASIFTAVTHEIDIEQPFLGIDVRINNDSDDEVVVAPGDEAQIAVEVTNTLSGTLYDGEIAIGLSGNALDDAEVKTTQGFYDSTSKTIRWDKSSASGLEELQPGGSVTVSFSVRPKISGSGSRTPQIALVVDVSGRRVFENGVPQQLSGTASRTIKVESSAVLGSVAMYSVGPFENTGPMPPRAEEVTTYSITLGVINGSNAVTDATVEAALPPYITWLDLKTAGARFSYNPVSRTVTWDVGDLSAGESRDASFQISLLPSVSQVNQTPTLVAEQRFRATDRFTGTTIRTTSRALTTRLTEDPDPDAQDGTVLPKAGDDD